jgi:branched-chain amino acid transport system permease protein
MRSDKKAMGVGETLLVAQKFLFTTWARHQLCVALVALFIAIAVAVGVNTRYVVTILINCCMYGILALSLNLLAGFMGITSLGHAAFFGIGAYTAAILSTRFGTNFLVDFVAAMLTSGLTAFLLGLPTLKATGRHFAIITLGFCEITRIVEFNWMSLTRGPLGLPNIPTFSLLGVRLGLPLQKFSIALALLCVSYYVTSSLVNSRTGRALAAIRDNDVAAEAIGIDVYRYKLAIFTVSASMAGIAGAFYARHITFVDPKAFSFDQSILILSMVILGGMGSVPGSVIGAVLLSVIPELLRGMSELRLSIYGLIIVLMMVLKPNGFLGGYNLRYMYQKSSFQREAGAGNP